MTLERVVSEIRDLEEAPFSDKNVYDLAMLYIVRDHMQNLATYEKKHKLQGNMQTAVVKPVKLGDTNKPESQFDKETATAWVENMEDGEGVKGGRYTWHQAQQYAMNKGITGEKRLIEFYAAMNAMYSDYHDVAKKFGVDKPEFYACMAKSFIEDPDAVDDKLAMYYEHVVRHDE